MRRIPGFAGLYIDEGGEGRAIRTRTVAYTLPELSGWFEATSPAVLSVPGAVFVDLDERANRVTIGVDDAGLIERARQIAREAGVPEGAAVAPGMYAVRGSVPTDQPEPLRTLPEPLRISRP